MAIDLDRERLMSLNAAADLLSQLLGPRIAYKTAYNWSRCGIKKVKLDSVRIGESLFTTREAVIRFVEAVLSADSKGHDWFRLQGANSRAVVASALTALATELNP